MRWDSPPERVGPLRCEGQVVEAHVDQKAQAADDLLDQFLGDQFAVAGQRLNLIRKSWAWPMVMAVTSMIDWSAMRTCSTSGLRRRPLQVGAGLGRHETGIVLFLVLRLGLEVAAHHGVQQSLPCQVSPGPGFFPSSS